MGRALSSYLLWRCPVHVLLHCRNCLETAQQIRSVLGGCHGTRRALFWPFHMLKEMAASLVRSCGTLFRICQKTRRRACAPGSSSRRKDGSLSECLSTPRLSWCVSS